MKPIPVAERVVVPTTAVPDGAPHYLFADRTTAEQFIDGRFPDVPPIIETRVNRAWPWAVIRKPC